jgi:hypothetical protein
MPNVNLSAVLTGALAFVVGMAIWKSVETRVPKI